MITFFKTILIMHCFFLSLIGGLKKMCGSLIGFKSAHHSPVGWKYNNKTLIFFILCGLCTFPFASAQNLNIEAKIGEPYLYKTAFKRPNQVKFNKDLVVKIDSVFTYTSDSVEIINSITIDSARYELDLLIYKSNHQIYLEYPLKERYTSEDISYQADTVIINSYVKQGIWNPIQEYCLYLYIDSLLTDKISVNENDHSIGHRRFQYNIDRRLFTVDLIGKDSIMNIYTISYALESPEYRYSSKMIRYKVFDKDSSAPLVADVAVFFDENNNELYRTTFSSWIDKVQYFCYNDQYLERIVSRSRNLASGNKHRTTLLSTLYEILIIPKKKQNAVIKYSYILYPPPVVNFKEFRNIEKAAFKFTANDFSPLRIKDEELQKMFLNKVTRSYFLEY